MFNRGHGGISINRNNIAFGIVFCYRHPISCVLINGTAVVFAVDGVIFYSASIRGDIFRYGIFISVWIIRNVAYGICFYRTVGIIVCGFFCFAVLVKLYKLFWCTIGVIGDGLTLFVDSVFL